MPASHAKRASCFHYSALDYLWATEHSGSIALSFYQAGRWSNEIEGGNRLTAVHHENVLLGVRHWTHDSAQHALTGCDAHSCVLQVIGSSPLQRAYSAYGHCAGLNDRSGYLGFNGERIDPATGCYLLGQYRFFNPLLMRFISPDSWAPLGAGGLNAYAYCVGDPINKVDPSGHAGFLTLILPALKSWARRAKATVATQRTALPASVAINSDSSIKLTRQRVEVLMTEKPSMARSTSPAATYAGVSVDGRTPHWGDMHPADYNDGHDFFRNMQNFDDVWQFGYRGASVPASTRPFSLPRARLGRAPNTGVQVSPPRPSTSIEEPPSYQMFAPPSYEEAMHAQRRASLGKLPRQSKQIRSAS
ncbi:hypothetical protein DCO48_07040 [Pseudomonas sp. SDI]|uniref:RHS repeat-associated core domain-containing protein n=1 Tax=Pseudomonas sp. SDI TaxID=2170734 RepID=UPI000DE6FAF7|nr:RHS repeat-associated core domain-containing protein [Pseudomonas sp. SDI]PWB34052.1 hypothetical protein DCO48_07040 [Pseudomonas sp. SDI]